jgi:hypothetical protein
MKNLYELLKPEIKEVLETEKNLYPFLISGIKKELNENFFWIYLTVNTANHLCNFNKKIFDIIELSNLFLKDE